MDYEEAKEKINRLPAMITIFADRYDERKVIKEGKK